MDEGVIRIDFQVLLGSHVDHGGGVLQSLCLHDALHVGGTASLECDETVSKEGLLLHVRAQGLILGLVLVLLKFLLFLLILGQLKPLHGDGHEGLAILHRQLHGVLINGISYVPDLVAALLDALDDSRVRHRLAALAGDVVDGLLVLLHASDVVLKAGHVISGSR